MATVQITGIFMNAEVKTTTFDGVSKTALYLDVYQKDSKSKDKLVQLKTDDVSLINTLNQEYDLGSEIQTTALVNAYKNEAYFKLLEVVA